MAQYSAPASGDMGKRQLARADNRIGAGRAACPCTPFTCIHRPRRVKYAL